MDDQTGDRDLRADMLDALQLMALPPDGQIAALPAFVATADEIALIFDEVFRAIDTRYADALFTEDQLTALRAIYRILNTMSQAPKESAATAHEAWVQSTWTHEALRTDPRWADLRDRALSLLTMLDATPGQPRLSGITYVSETEAWHGGSDP
ncbi:hypothetical protein [Luedemannella helvata]|uniref:hypothetical protein n=1 Tax=Luedemannella helvata TaxID=349315 RepID=UPI0031D3E550